MERDCESIFYKCYFITLAHCPQGCQYGDCTAVNTCTCQSGWTGDSCNTGMISFSYIDYNECNANQNTYHCGKATYKNHYYFCYALLKTYNHACSNILLKTLWLDNYLIFHCVPD